ncbi:MULTISPECIES: alanyl-tRNA editing protein [Rhizobium]|uniref:Alanine--tRNA ligase n=1 Tax=Rhizobium rhododendri TaxID=2506430 RepID=A0ABY8IM69_9HYPH|nr:MULTISPECIES: alanyl-tRNA editing protein [Rhizobium]MBZ5761432.1 alanyl-tRNA editing protein [Rhizobium sp. VS19-DR96]MBZ5767380.1 alanyl-tRNA editing protein [Rhizobium sp. VS19-DR129.2]MBZ5775171.1 alanyl-tRNA editing protein [Rhizobium sp. VS19-DRK62.2]MBZ5785864.1 alanyl-tRNA editing protein [Rhizobium sp. VS19-DR121]MBZ5803290.1 alanyl-tRNA editing protein [Rhizobium sp. VS19-DR181]
MTVEALFRDDFYLSTVEATVTAVHEDGSIEVDRTCFYATSGGQPGDTGFLERSDGSRIMLGQARHGATKDIILHTPLEGEAVPSVGETVVLHIDWPRRYRLMRMHTACHLLSVVCPYPITGAAVGEDESRVDFDMSEAIDKDDVTAKLMTLVNENHPITLQWITDEELAANPGIVKSKNVRPPIGLGRVSLVCIGESSSVDSQPCGGTHVSETQEVGAIFIAKIEKKGKENRRFRIRFGTPGQEA